MSQEEEHVPEWLADLEKPKKYKLAHEVGAGTPCFGCTYCSGLQLHYWRKICTLCGCHFEDHDTANEAFPQYQIIYGDNKRRKTVLPFNGEPTSFDWVPVQHQESLVVDYMSQLPKEWRPITGSIGGIYRKKQLGRQLPLYDVDIESCLPLSANEMKHFEAYQSSLRINAAGLGSVLKLGEEDGIYCATPAWVVDTATSELIGLSPQYTGQLRTKEKEHENAPIFSQCHKCKKPLGSNAVAVRVTKVYGALWHAACFSCVTCGELLVDLHYFYHEGKVYCGRDYAKAVNKLRCAACDELIFENEFTGAEGKFYHNRHFCCFICDEPLGGMQFLYKNGQIICPGCYQNRFSKICVTCKEIVPLYEQRLLVGSNVYHKSPSCFRCSDCERSLEFERVSIEGSQILCLSCSATKTDE